MFPFQVAQDFPFESFTSFVIQYSARVSLGRAAGNSRLKMSTVAGVGSPQNMHKGCKHTVGDATGLSL